MTKQVILFILFLTYSHFSFAQESNLKFNRIEDIEKGRELQALLDRGETDSLFGMMSDQFKTAIKDKDNFKKLSNSVGPQLGKEISLLEEASFDEAGIVSYYQISRYENVPSVTKKWIWKDSLIMGMSITPTPAPAETEKKFYQTKTSLRLPFEGTWYTAWGGDEAYLNKHVQSSNQRFAFDFLKIENGNLVKEGEREANSDFYTYGANILAPGDGIVVKVVDSVQDNILGERNEKVPPGNHIVIDHGNGEYSFLAHLQPNSIKVKNGDKVKAGDFLGLAGNSGRSDVPHLHFHLQTGQEYNEGEGLPVQFRGYSQNGQEVKNTSPVRGYLISNLE